MITLILYEKILIIGLAWGPQRGYRWVFSEYPRKPGPEKIGLVIYRLMSRASLIDVTFIPVLSLPPYRSSMASLSSSDKFEL